MKSIITILAILLASCGGAQRQACYLTAESNADQAVYERCVKRGVTWSECPDREAIMAELASEQSRCQ